MSEDLSFVEGFREVALKIGRGHVAVYAWDWGLADGSREEWQRHLDEAALDLNIVIHFTALPAKNMTVAFNADSPPPKERVDLAVRAVEKHRDVDAAIPGAHNVALVHQHVPRLAL